MAYVGRKPADAALTSDDLASGIVSADKLASNAVTTVKVTDVNHFSAYDIIKFKKVVFTESSVKELEKRYL